MRFCEPSSENAAKALLAIEIVRDFMQSTGLFFAFLYDGVEGDNMVFHGREFYGRLYNILALDFRLWMPEINITLIYFDCLQYYWVLQVLAFLGVGA